MKLKVQAQHLQPGDIVGSGERIARVIINSTKWASNKVMVVFDSQLGEYSKLWGKHTMINVERNNGI